MNPEDASRQVMLAGRAARAGAGQAERKSRFGCDLCEKRVPVSSSRQISDHLGVWARTD